jgi:hypothetical protein
VKKQKTMSEYAMKYVQNNSGKYMAKYVVNSLGCYMSVEEAFDVIVTLLVTSVMIRIIKL